MINKLLILICITCVLVIVSCSSEYYVKDTIIQKEIELSGTIVLEGWAKDVDSYCSQGSDWFILQINETNREILKYSKELYQYNNKSVTAKGNMVHRIIHNHPSEKHSSQIPISLSGSPNGDDYSCILFEIKSLSEK